MKKLLLAFLCVTSTLLFSQNNNYNKVWDLLLKNKRTEARNLFNKEFSSKTSQDFEALYLDGILNVEEGKLSFDEEFTKKFVAISPNKNYLIANFYANFFIGKPDSQGVDDNFYKKIDLLSNSIYANELNVKYYKSFADKLRRNDEGYQKAINDIGAINKWQFCGVFENLNGSGLDIEYEPEIYAKNDKQFNANSNGIVNWYNPKDVDKGVYHFYSNESEYAEGIMFAQTFVESPDDREVYIELGSNSEFKAYLNDVEIVRSSKEFFKEIGNYLVKVKLSKGMNRLVMKSELSASTAIFAHITDKDKNKFTDLKYYDTYQNYQKKTLSEVNPIEQNFAYEDFLLQKIKENPTSISHKIMLLNAYLNFYQNEKARNLLDDLLKQYPQSSMLNILNVAYNNNVEETQKSQEILKNIEINDPDYYYNVITKVSDSEFLKSSSMEELQKVRDLSAKTKAIVFTDIIDLMTQLRKSNLSEIAPRLDAILEHSYNNETYLSSFLQLYDYQKTNNVGALQKLEKALEKRDNYTLLLQLVNYYVDANREDDAKKILKKLSSDYPHANHYREKLVELLIKEKKFEEALEEVNHNLANFPYSFGSLSSKGVLYSNLNNKDEAVKNFKASLSHNSANQTVNKYLEDLTKKANEIENVSVKDLYALAKERRNSKLKGELGVTTLLDEYIVNVFEEGGLKKRSTYLYEITSESGIEELKEYSVDGDLKKAEIIKPNGSIVPGEDSYGYVVFSNLEVGDVVIIQYDSVEKFSGRFYKDFNTASYFNSYYPVVESTFTVITPENLKYNVVYNNGNVPFTTKKIDGKTYTNWTLKNLPQISKEENFAKPYADIANSVNVGTLNSWKDIANWYSDLVKKVAVSDKVTDKAFLEIFPNGNNGLSQYETAEKIYNYIEKNVKYSSVDFRQSGYIPQKPSKTIISKLGDCKDLSTLFMVLAQKAGIQANLVLVSTNDNAKNYLAVPTIDFNHCIVKTTLDGKETFLEMTDKFLPFNSISRTNVNAKALVIGKEKSEIENAKLIELPYNNNIRTNISVNTSVNIEDNKKTVTAKFQHSGESKAIFNDLFSENYSEDDRKSKIEEDLGGAINKVIVSQSINLISGKDLSANPIVYEIKFNIDEKPQTVGSMKLVQVPFLAKAYTKELIALENRKFDINYIIYENVNHYKEEVILNIPSSAKFIEVPENKTLQYKNHTYSIKYELLSPNQLKITKVANPSWENITVAEYQDFKKFVNEIIQAEEQIIAYK